jgi:Asp-tRNA(Asn)/Glu-tRNA(Gln) amidotransferase A subunit family amidase
MADEVDRAAGDAITGDGTGPGVSGPDRAAAGGPVRGGASLDRRAFLGILAAGGAGATLPASLLAALQEAGPVTVADLEAAERMVGLSFTDEERTQMVESINERVDLYRALRKVPVDETVAPALVFDPTVEPMSLPEVEVPLDFTEDGPGRRPEDPDLAYASVGELQGLLSAGRISSEELTRLYLDRLKTYGPELECVVSLTEDLALQEARSSDAERARGRVRSPLHGIPWGAKDLLATARYRTTWGAAPFKEQSFDYDATVVERLRDAGAVLTAKLTLGALAQGDIWFGGQTRNPFNLEEGSRGSSAGSAAAVVAGLTGFTIGSETLGSITSPSDRCGATGLRPTFGRVSRHGAMALSWSMDKLGPICRTVEDCAAVLQVIQGADGRDITARNVPLGWDPGSDFRTLRVGFLRSAFEADSSTAPFDRDCLEVLRRMGVRPVAVELPDQFPLSALSTLVLHPEQGASFDSLIRENREDLLVNQRRNARPDRLRQSRFIPGVEYVQANRVRRLLMEDMARRMDGIDVLVTPTRAPGISTITNLTGHPSLTLRSGFRENGTPVSITLVGGLFGERHLLTLGKAFQDETGLHRSRPPLFST